MKTDQLVMIQKKQVDHLKNRTLIWRIAKRQTLCLERWIERMKTEGIQNPLSCFKDVPIKNLSMLDIANIYSDRKRRFSDASKLEEKEANVEAV